MNMAIDVYYRAENAIVAGITFTHWRACEPDRELVTWVSKVDSYEPGHFYRRELPGMLELLNQTDLLPGYIVIDGYVYLGPDEKPGLGKHLYDALNARSAIIGVAKNRFKDTPAEAELIRGNSKRPLYITSVGVSQMEAKQLISSMCGEYRLPTLLKKVDQLCRSELYLQFRSDRNAS